MGLRISEGQEGSVAGNRGKVSGSGFQVSGLRHAGAGEGQGKMMRDGCEPYSMTPSSSRRRRRSHRPFLTVHGLLFTIQRFTL